MKNDFTAKDRQIAELLLEGCSNAAIAEKLGMGKRSVKAHFNRLFLRFGLYDGSKRIKLARELLKDTAWRESKNRESVTAAGN